MIEKDKSTYLFKTEIRNGYTKLGSLDDLPRYLDDIRFLDHEEFVVFGCTKKLVLLYKDIISDKIQTHKVNFHLRPLFNRALHEKADGIIVCHNHPTLSPHPSEIDYQLLEDIKRDCKELEIELYDFCIIHGMEFYSCYAERKIDRSPDLNWTQNNKFQSRDYEFYKKYEEKLKELHSLVEEIYQLKKDNNYI